MDALHFTVFGTGISFPNIIKLSGFSYHPSPQYIPKKEFERIMKKVEQERKQKSVGIWGGFCSVTSAKDDDKELIGDSIKQSKLQAASKAINDGEIQSIIESFHKKNNNTPVSAPFFGSSVKLGKRKTIHVGRAGDKVVGNIPDVQMLAKKQEKSKYLSAKSGSSSSSTLSFHIMDEVYEEPQETAVKIQVSTTQIEDENASGGSSVDEDSSLRDEMMRLCDEITNANRTKESDVEDSSVDLTCQDEQFFRGITEKVKEITSDDDDSIIQFSVLFTARAKRNSLAHRIASSSIRNLISSSTNVRVLLVMGTKTKQKRRRLR